MDKQNIEKLHLISVLGTSFYEPVFYGDSSKEEAFIQAALIEKYHDRLAENGKVTIFVTDRARIDNWNDRLYTSRDVETARKWRPEIRGTVIEGETRKGLNSILQEQFPDLCGKINSVRIPDGNSEDEIWEIFERLYQELGDEEDVVFDITHSFRSIPMLAMTVINYARDIKNCRLSGIFYGAYEAAPKDIVPKKAPIFDLTSYNDILEWTNAVEFYSRFGDVKRLKELYEKKINSLDVEAKKRWGKGVRPVINSMEALADAIHTCRGTDAVALGVKPQAAAGSSIKNAYQNLKKSIAENNNGEMLAEIKPLYPLFEKAVKDFSIFNENENYRIGLATVKWSIENGMTEQGYTALEETIKTYLCFKYDIDDRTEDTRDGWIGCILNSIAAFFIVNKSSGISDNSRNDLFRFITEENDFSKSVYDSLNETEKAKWREVILTIPGEIVVLSGKVKNRRNDINHFGFRNVPARSKQMIDDLEKYYMDFMSVVSISNNEGSEDGHS